MVRPDLARRNHPQFAVLLSDHRNISLVGSHDPVRRSDRSKSAALPDHHEAPTGSAGRRRPVALGVLEFGGDSRVRRPVVSLGSLEVLRERALPGKDDVPVCGDCFSLHDSSGGHAKRSRSESVLGISRRRYQLHTLAGSRFGRTRYRFPMILGSEYDKVSWRIWTES